MEPIIRIAKSFIPRKIFAFFQPLYHFLLALTGALLYRFPSRKLIVVGITGTKGKSSVVEILRKILEEAGFKTAAMGTIRFSIAGQAEPNLFKMTMPGRFFTQKFLRKAVDAGCTHAVVEMTSEGAKQFRHLFIDLDALIVTNIAREHIEAHGSYEKYIAAKYKIVKQLARSFKRHRALIVNTDSEKAAAFLSTKRITPVPFSLKDAEPFELLPNGTQFTFEGKTITTRLRGIFNIVNCFAAALAARRLDVGTEIIKAALAGIETIPGRAEEIQGGQDFTVVIDYAHTPDSLTAVYEAFKPTSARSSKLICVLGNTGGGRDTWKRPEMGKIADSYCDEIILTNEDPYDEEPRSIVEAMAKGISKHKAEIIMDRRKAIRTALQKAKAGDTVLITGKGTDPYIMGPKGTKESWSDRRVAEEELQQLFKKG